MNIGDYVQNRKYPQRGEIVQIDPGDWIRVMTVQPGQDELFWYEHASNLVRILRKRECEPSW